jgi:hypothetical protein
MRRSAFLATALSALVALFSVARAEPSPAPAADDQSLAKQTQNPIASLTSIPVQLNFYGGIGPFDRTQMVLNLQPIIPIKLTGRLALVTRWILPLVGQPDATRASGSTWGLGDFNPQIYLAVELPHGFTVAPGLTAVLPTATDALLGAGKLSLGPAVAVVFSGGPVVVGFLITNAFSITGPSSRAKVDLFTLQPFLNINLPKTIYLTTAPQIIGDWEASQWTVPVGLGVGKILELGVLPVNVSVQAYWNAVTPAGGATWQVRSNVQFLFPQK